MIEELCDNQENFVQLPEPMIWRWKETLFYNLNSVIGKIYF